MIENKIKKGLGRGLSSLLGDSSKKVQSNKLQFYDECRRTQASFCKDTF